jgi:hypothetical protein
MAELTRAMIVFGKAYFVAVIALGILALVASRFVTTDALALYQLLLGFMGGGYVFASILSWTGFGNMYRYSPTLFIGSHSYRRTIAQGTIAKEGRDRGSLGIGIFFGLALLGSALALLGWIFAASVLAVAIALVFLMRSLEKSPAKSA